MIQIHLLKRLKITKYPDVFNFSKDEIKMRDTFEFVWLKCNSNLFLNFAKEIIK